MKLLVGVCTRGADIHFKTYEFMAHTVFSTPGAQMVMVHSPFAASDGQEKLFNMFADSDFDYLLVVDADVVPQLDAFAKMVAHDKQIVLAPVWFYNDKYNTIAYGAYHQWAKNKKEEREKVQRVVKTKGLEKVVSGGFGCMLVRKDVVQKFRDNNLLFAKWDKSLGEHMQERASDNIFWAKCTNLEIDAYIDWSIETTHYRTVGLCNKLVESISKAKEKKCSKR